jgi:hypothetical protein
MAGKVRSPNYPGLTLSEALQRLREFYDREKTAHTAPEVAVKAWGYGGLNGASARVLGALRQYGLLQDVGKDVKVSERGLALLLDPPASHEYRNALSAAAREPAMFAEILAEYPDSLPSEQGLIAYLVRRRGFTEDGARKLNAVLRDTISFAGSSDAENSELPSSTPEFGSAPALTAQASSSQVPQSYASTAPAIAVPMGAVNYDWRFQLPNGVAVLSFSGAKLTERDVRRLYQYLDITRENLEDIAANASGEGEKEAGAE